MSPPRLLTSPELRLLLFGGKGGVGKTTCAAAATLSLARRFPERSWLLYSTDPAHSLKDSLADLRLPGRIQVLEFDAAAYLEEFRRLHGAKLQTIAERGTFLDSEDIGRFLSLSLPGMDELFGFLDLARRARDGDGGECIVVDTAPSGHTLRLLAMPELLRGWVDVLDTMLAKHRYMKQIFSRRYVEDEIDRFLDELSDSVDAAEGLLRDPRRCRFVPVMVAEELSVRETAALLAELDRLHILADEVVVNMLAPENECPSCAASRARQFEQLSQLPERFGGRALWGAPLRPHEVRGALLESFWDEASPLDPRACPRRAASALPEPAVVDPAPHPAEGLELLFFAGKGGVGKTTLACATALRLAREAPGRGLMLFSTDPAHSLSDCLGMRIGPQPRPVASGLTALEMDAAADLEALKRQYREEIDDFFGQLLGRFDVPFDRAVMEQVIELVPPGIDEMMALGRAVDFLSERTYGLLVLDSAPTGHLLRLLEMPALLDDWLKAFFELFLKYRQVLQMPAFADRLVEASKQLHRFRALLRDPARSALYAVSIPTQLALEETRDLAAACGRMGVSVPALFLNQLTRESGCALCDARAGDERLLTERFARELPMRLTRVFRGAEPRGLQSLGRLGAALYLEAAQKGAHPDAGL